MFSEDDLIKFKVILPKDLYGSLYDLNEISENGFIFSTNKQLNLRFILNEIELIKSNLAKQESGYNVSEESLLLPKKQLSIQLQQKLNQFRVKIIASLHTQREYLKFKNIRTQVQRFPDPTVKSLALFVSLPAEILQKIIGYFSIYERQQMRLVCKGFRDNVDDSIINERAVFLFNQYGVSVLFLESGKTYQDIMNLMRSKLPLIINERIKTTARGYENNVKAFAYNFCWLILVGLFTIAVFVGTVMLLLHIMKSHYIQHVESTRAMVFKCVPILLAGIFLIVLPWLLLFTSLRKRVTDCFAQCKYGRFFSSGDIQKNIVDEEVGIVHEDKLSINSASNHTQGLLELRRV